MEAVGRLAGGVAHDFNHLLTVVVTNASALACDSRVPAGVQPEIEEIRCAAARGTQLVRQLLTFGRREQVQEQGLRVVFVSGYSWNEELPESDPSHGIAYLRKPFSAPELAQKLSDLLLHASELDAQAGLLGSRDPLTAEPFPEHGGP